MGAPYTNLRGKIEDVFYDYFQSIEGFSIPVYRAADIVDKNQEISVPCISIICPRTAPQMPEVDSRAAVQNRACDLEVIVISDTANPPTGYTVRQYHDNIVGQIMDMLYDSELVTLLNARNIDGIGIIQADQMEQTFTVRGNNYETTLSFVVNAYAKLN